MVSSGKQKMEVRFHGPLLHTGPGRRCLVWPLPTALPVWEGLLLRRIRDKRSLARRGHSTRDLLWGPVSRVGPGLSPPGGLGSTELPSASQPHPEALRVLEVHLPQAGQDSPLPSPPSSVLVGLGGDQGQTPASFGQADLCVSVRG